MYALPPSPLPFDPVDGCDTRHLNHSHQPVINPLKSLSDILLYNDTLFSPRSLTLQPKFDYTPKTLHALSHCSPNQFPSLSSLHKESDIVYHSRNIDQFITPIPKTFFSLELFLQLTLSGPLIFIQYVPEQTIRPCWYLIEILPFANIRIDFCLKKQVSKKFTV